MDKLCAEELDSYLLEQNGKIIHQIWFGIIPNKRAAKKALVGLEKYRSSWLIKNPGWVYMCWDFKKCSEFMRMYYKEHLEMYNGYPYHIQRCDAVRYFLLHRYGGIYADMDYYCNRPFDEALSFYTNNLYLVETPNKLGDSIHVSNSLMYSQPGHVFWKKLFIEMEMNKLVPYYYGRHLAIMFTTGPGILNRVYHSYKSRYRLSYFPYKMFHPFGLSTDIKTLNDMPDVYAMHLGKGSWETNDSGLIIFAYREHKIILFIVLVLILPSLLLWLSKFKSKKLTLAV